MLDIILTLESISITSIVLLLCLLYVASTAIFLVLENRTPQSTMAWMFALPVPPNSSQFPEVTPFSILI